MVIPPHTRASQHRAVPSRRCQRDGPRFILEHPSGEVSAPPRTTSFNDVEGDVGAPTRCEHFAQSVRHPMVGEEMMPHRLFVLRRAVGRIGASQDRLGSNPSGEQGLSDALTGEEVGGGSSITDEENSPTRQRHGIDAGRDRPSRVSSDRLCPRTESVHHVLTAQEVTPRFSEVTPRQPTVAQHTETDVRPTARERKRPGVSGQQVGFEPDDEAFSGGARHMLYVLAEGVPFAAIPGDPGAEHPADGRPHAISRDHGVGAHDTKTIDNHIDCVGSAVDPRSRHALMDRGSTRCGKFDQRSIKVESCRNGGVHAVTGKRNLELAAAW